MLHAIFVGSPVFDFYTLSIMHIRVIRSSRVAITDQEDSIQQQRDDCTAEPWILLDLELDLDLAVRGPNHVGTGLLVKRVLRATRIIRIAR